MQEECVTPRAEGTRRVTEREDINTGETRGVAFSQQGSTEASQAGR